MTQSLDVRDIFDLICYSQVLHRKYQDDLAKLSVAVHRVPHYTHMSIVYCEAYDASTRKEATSIEVPVSAPACVMRRHAVEGNNGCTLQTPRFGRHDSAIDKSIGTPRYDHTFSEPEGTGCLTLLRFEFPRIRIHANQSILRCSTSFSCKSRRSEPSCCDSSSTRSKGIYLLFCQDEDDDEFSFCQRRQVMQGRQG